MGITHERYRSCDAIDLAELVRQGDVLTEDLLEVATRAALQLQPRLNAIAHWQLEAARQDPNLVANQGPLSGIPFLLKDITTHVVDWPMTSGSAVYRDFVSTVNSTIVERYRAAGLVLFGRTTTPEFGYAATTESRLFGPTRNPWDLQLSAGGSSGGAAVAVAAGIVPAAQGGDSGGSLRIPAAFCGLYGLKPTRARTPAGPYHGSFLGFSSAHVITRSVRDSALFLDVASGPDVGAPYFAERPEVSFLKAAGRRPRRIRIAVQRRAYDDSVVDADCLEALEGAAALCLGLGHEVVDVDFRFDHRKLRSLYFLVWPTLVRLALDQRAAATGRPWHPDDLETYVARLVEGVRDVSALAFAQALEDINAVAREFRLQSDAFDAVLSPTTALVAPRVGVLDPSNPDQDELDMALSRAVAFTQIYNVTGQPAASLPLHWTSRGIPVGVQLATRYGDEALLLQISRQIEEAMPWFHRVPALLA